MDSVKSMRAAISGYGLTEENDVLVLSVYNTGMPMNKRYGGKNQRAYTFA